jgi:hypothetical protein
MSLVGADLDAVQTEHARAVLRSIRGPGGVTVIGEDEEFEARSSGRGGDLVGAAQAVGAVGVNMEDAGNRAIVPGRKRQVTRRKSERNECSEGGSDPCRQQNELSQE